MVLGGVSHSLPPPPPPVPPQFSALSTSTCASPQSIPAALKSSNFNTNSSATIAATATSRVPTFDSFHKHDSRQMMDGSQMFPYLWGYFLRHSELRDWLMRAPPYTSASFAPSHVAQGIAFCCNFEVPSIWADMAPVFDLGEMFIPDHSVGQFMCGSVVAGTTLHKHLVCALGPAASRDPIQLPSYRTAARRMVIDMSSSQSITMIEFSWMCDGALIVTAKVLVIPPRDRPYDSAGCTGAFAIFSDVVPGGPVPEAPRSLVSFVEAPRCPSCIQTGCLGCYCRQPDSSSGFSSPSSSPSHPTSPTSPVSSNLRTSSAAWPPQPPYDVNGSAVHNYQNVRLRLRLIQHIAHVKITAHVVTTQQIENELGLPSTSYHLGPSRFVVKAVRFRTAIPLEADTLRQVADKLRLLRCAALRMASEALHPSSKSTTAPMLTQSQRERTSKEPVSQPYQIKTDRYKHTDRALINAAGSSNIPSNNTAKIEHEVGADYPDSSFISFYNSDIPTPPSPTSPQSPSEGVVPKLTSLCVACVVQGVKGDGSRCAACSQSAMLNAHISKKSEMMLMPMSTTPVSTQCASPAEGNSWLTTEVLSKVTEPVSYTPTCMLQAPPPARLRCPRCEKTFSQQGSLNRHLKNIHDQRKIPCDYCMMTFGQMFDLKVSFFLPTFVYERLFHPLSFPFVLPSFIRLSILF